MSRVSGLVDERPEPRRATVALTLLAGFLGAGKTTLLNHLVRGNHGKRLGVVVNDFGEINIDAELVANVDGETVTLTNGCICCTIRDDLLLTLFRLLQRPDAPEHVIVEASGVSDPAAVVQSFADARMFEIVRLDSVVVVVDAEQFEGLEFRVQPLALHQLVVADLVVLNKVDLVDADALARLCERIEGIVPAARIVLAEHGRVAFDMVLGIGRFDLGRLLALESIEVHTHTLESPAHHHHGIAFETWAFTSARPLVADRLAQTLATLPAAVYRAKGIAWIVGEQTEVVAHVVGKRVEFAAGELWPAGERATKIVTIAVAGELDRERLQAGFAACEATPAEAAAAVPRLRSLAQWLRGLWRRRG